MTKAGSQGAFEYEQGAQRYISISIGYPWSKDENQKLVSVRNDARWRSIRDLTKKVAEAAKSIADQRTQAPFKFDARISRLRGTHGQLLLQNLISRIRAADILIMDIGSTELNRFNSNVLIEVGIAMAFDSIAHKPAFILKPEGSSHPSDLSGFLFTEYKPVEGSGEIKLVDELGFHAALRSKILVVASEKNMLGARKESGTEVENDDSETSKSAKKQKTHNK